MKEYQKEVMKQLRNRLETKAIIFLLCSGVLLCTIFLHQSYLNVMYKTFTSDILLIFCYYPGLILLIHLFHQSIHKNSTILIHSQTRKKLMKFQATSTLKIIITFFLFFLFLTILCCNLFAKNFNLALPLPYETNQYFVIGILLLKVFLTSILLGMIYLFFNYQIKSQKTKLILMILLILLILFGREADLSNYHLLNWLNIGYHSHEMTSNISFLNIIVSDVSFFIINFYIYFRLILKSGYETDFMLEQK